MALLGAVKRRKARHFSCNFIPFQYNQVTCFIFLLYYSMEEGTKTTELPAVQAEHQKIQTCLSKFPTLQEKIGSSQLSSIQLKYQYFLRKFQKYTEEHQKYKQMYENIDSMIEESNQMKEENRSIDFIKKVMEDTEKRYSVLKENIDSLRQNKEDTKRELARLKSILQKVKRDCFELERRETELQESFKCAERAEKRTEIHKTMFKIRSEKKASQTEGVRTKKVVLEQLAANTSGFVDHKISEQLQLINRIKDQFLSSIGINLREYYKLSQKGYAQQNYANSLIKKREFKIRDKCVLKGIENYGPADSAVEVFRITQEYEKERQQFMGLRGEEILDLIIRKNKVGEVLHMIQEEKREVISAYRNIKSTK